MDEVIRADLNKAEHGEALVMLLDAYARDEMGGATPLPAAPGGPCAAGLGRWQTRRGSDLLRGILNLCLPPAAQYS